MEEVGERRKSYKAILVVGLILGVGIPLRNKAIKKRRENMKEKGNEEK